MSVGRGSSRFNRQTSTGTTTTTQPPRVDAGGATAAANRAADEILGAGVQQEDTGPKPIGVSGDYRVSRRQEAGTNKSAMIVADPEAGELWIGPGYYQGDEMMFAGMDEEWIANLQGELIGAGLLDGDGPWVKGGWDDYTMGAFQTVLAYANRRGLTWQAALEEYKAGFADFQGRQKRPTGPTRAPLVIRLTNADDLKKLFRQAAYQMLGGGGFIDDAQVDQMVSAYHQVEASAQRAAYNAGPGGGTVQQAPAADTFAEDKLEELDPDGVKAGRFASYVQVFERLLGSPIAGAPQAGQIA